MGRSPRPLEDGLGHEEEIPSEIVHMVPEKDCDGLEKVPQCSPPPSSCSEDGQIRNRTTSMMSPFFRGFILAAFILMALHNISVNPTWLKSPVGA